METRLVIFVASVTVTLAINTAMLWFAYKGFASLSSKVSRRMTELESRRTRAWIESMEVAAQHAVTLTEATKQRVAEVEPVIDRAHEKYVRTLGKIDSKLAKAADEVTTGAKKMRDVVAKPAFSVIGFAAGLGETLKDWQGEETGDEGADPYTP